MKYPLKDYLEAGLRLVGILPTRYIYVPFKGIVEIDRCDTDGGIVTDSQSSLSGHVGHRLKHPGKVSFFEVFLMWVRIIR